MTATIIHNEASRARVAQLISNLSVDKRWKVEVKQDKPRRSRAQNALMWKWIDDIAQKLHEETGQDKDDIHEFFKRKFCPVTVISIGSEDAYVRSTKKLNVREMQAYMKAIEGYCASEWAISLPIPEEMARYD